MARKRNGQLWNTYAAEKWGGAFETETDHGPMQFGPNSSHMRPDDGSEQIRVGKSGPKAETKAQRRKRHANETDEQRQMRRKRNKRLNGGKARKGPKKRK